MTDRLAEIKVAWARPEFHPPDVSHTLPRSDIDWLISEVERLRAAKEPWRIGEYSNVG